ncbi:helix-turn-helix transcriptional regulator [Salipaludibacillus sp. CF4.18]|uniref:helix-turn-helix transcriptional regulator n=1 Tax=Salipaludibacillus sp. CF4.18 TaxID=3373081 RepID=UPI003EE4AFBA
MKAKSRSKINEYLESRGTTKAWLADRIGASRAQMSNWSKNENGVVVSQPSVGYVLKMMRVLDCKLDDIYEEVND